jgi:serine/threonine-protein phosphatase 2A activator
MESQATASSFDPASHTFKMPVKKIDDPMTHEAFKRSEACQDIVGFITALAASVQKTRMSQTPITEVLLHPALISLM